MTGPGRSAGRLLVFGEALVDVVVDATGTELRRAPGGSPLNVAVGLARLGVPTTLATCLGRDPLGRLLEAHLRTSGTALAAPATAGRTGTAVARLDADGVASYDLDVDWDPVPRPLPEDLDALHVGSLGTVLEPGRRLVLDSIRTANLRGIPVSYDPNVRPSTVCDPSAAWRDVRRIAAAATVVKLSSDDLAALQPGRDPAGVLAELLTGAATRLAVLTLGAGGAVAATATARAEVAAPPVDVVDTVGAGDAFTAGLLVALREAGLLSAPAAGYATERQLRAAVRAATEVAAYTCGRRGADPPFRCQLPPSWPYLPQ
jgi:fructokinase